MYDSIVLGCGIAGINTAYWLVQAGHKVLVIDRQPVPGNETSFANGGQIAVSHTEPWARPSAPLTVLKDLLRDDAPLLFRPRMDPHQWRWLVTWLGHCTPARWRHNAREALRLAGYSRQLMQQLQHQHTLAFHHQQQGVLHLYHSEQALEQARPGIELMQQLGCPRQLISPEQALTLEPALRWSETPLTGATHTPGDGSGDARLFCHQLRNICESMGVEFAFNTHIMQLLREGSRVHVRVNGDLGNRHLTARHIVVCMGPWSAPLLRPLKLYPNICPVKGYSISVPLKHPDHAPRISLGDDASRLVYSRLGDELRVAGTAELGGYSRELNLKRCDSILEQARRLFPRAGGFDKARFWTGLRPATPSGLPVIGKTRFDNLWLNTGHSLGWTMGCGSGRYAADLICGVSQPDYTAFELSTLREPSATDLS